MGLVCAGLLKHREDGDEIGFEDLRTRYSEGRVLQENQVGIGGRLHKHLV